MYRWLSSLVVVELYVPSRRVKCHPHAMIFGGILWGLLLYIVDCPVFEYHLGEMVGFGSRVGKRELCLGSSNLSYYVWKGFWGCQRKRELKLKI